MSTEPLINACVDVRFSEGLCGKALYVEWLGYEDNPNGTGWVMPGRGYGARILAMIERVSTVNASAVPAINLEDPQLAENALQTQTGNTALIFIFSVLLLFVLKSLLFSSPASKKRKRSVKAPGTYTRRGR